MAVQGWANAQEKFEPVTEIVAVIAIESVGTIINCELRPESDVDAVSMRQVAHITECVSTYRKDARTMVEKRRDILRALKTRTGLTRQQQQWLDSMEADLRKW